MDKKNAKYKIVPRQVIGHYNTVTLWDVYRKDYLLGFIPYWSQWYDSFHSLQGAKDVIKKREEKLPLPETVYVY